MTSSTTKLDIVQIGELLGVVLPEEIVQRLQIGVSDHFAVVNIADALVLIPAKSEIGQQIELGREFMQHYENTFSALAK